MNYCRGAVLRHKVSGDLAKIISETPFSYILETSQDGSIPLENLELRKDVLRNWNEITCIKLEFYQELYELL